MEESAPGQSNGVLKPPNGFPMSSPRPNRTVHPAKRPLTILFTLHSHICGGAEKHALALMDGVRQKGHRVAFAGPTDSWLAEQANQRGVPCFHIPLHGFYDVFSIVRLCRVACMVGADIVHGHLTRGAYYAGVAARLTRKASVSTAHLMNSHKRFDWTSQIIAVSAAVRDYLISQGHCGRKIAVIHNGIDIPDARPDLREPIRQTLGLSGEQIALCMISRLAEFKGHDLAINALARLNDPRLRLFIIGQTEGVDRYKVLHSQVMAAGLEDRVRFLGHREDVFALLSGMDVLLSASTREAFPTAILEASAVGVPAIASRVGGTTEIIRHRVNGLLVDAGDCDALAARIALLGSDTQLRHSLGEAARREARRRFSVDRMIESTARLYRRQLVRSCP